MLEQIIYYQQEFVNFLDLGSPAAIGASIDFFFLFVFVFIFGFLIYYFFHRDLEKELAEEKQRAKDFEEAYNAVSEGYLELCNKYREKEEENDSSV